jgi:TPP-dependent pyruvate/acetoin dehydrogenase alpha subunit
VAFIGDGTLGEGVVYETLNMASLWGAPVLFVVENNRIAQTTPVEIALAGNIRARFEAFDITTGELDTSDVCEILAAAGELLSAVRDEKKPHALVLHTHRFGPHSKGDDTRDEKALAKIRAERDPIRLHAGRVGEKEREQIEQRANDEVRQVFEQAKNDPFPEMAQAL